MKSTILILGLTFGLASAAGLQDDTRSLRLEHKQNGIILNLACEPISGAHITFTNKRIGREIIPAADGKFVVDLPAGDYSLSVAIDGRREIKPNELFVQRAKNADVRLLVNTDIESTCPCFEPEIEDLLIREEPLVINSQIVLRKPSPKP